VYAAMRPPFGKFRATLAGGIVTSDEKPPRVVQGANAAAPRRLPMASPDERLFCLWRT
jgi:hypothetical protein